MANEHAADLLVIAWQQWRALPARLRTQFGEPWNGDGPAPPGPPVEDTPALPFRVLAWQQWRAGRAQLTSQYATGALDDSVVVVPPTPDAPPAPPFVVLAWQQWQSLPARLVTQWSQQLWDGDGPPPPVPVPDFPPPSLTVLAWQQWRSGRTQLARQWTDAPQDLDGFLPFGLPDQSLVVLPWFAGRVPLEQARFAYQSANTDAFVDQVETMTSYTWGRGYRPGRVPLQARLNAVFGGGAQDESSTPTPLAAEYIPTYRPRRRL